MLKNIKLKKMHIVGRLKIIHFLKRLVFGQNVAAWLGAGSVGLQLEQQVPSPALGLKSIC